MEFHESLDQHSLGMPTLTKPLNKVFDSFSWYIKSHPDGSIPDCVESLAGTLEDVPETLSIELYKQ